MDTTDCPEWVPPIHAEDADAVCLTCNYAGYQHTPVAFMRGIGIPADIAQKVTLAVADKMEQG